MKRIIIFFAVAFVPLFGFSQNQEITGVIVAFNKYPLQNVTVSSNKAKIKTLTNENGNFKIGGKKKGHDCNRCRWF